LHNSKMPIFKWFLAISLLAEAKKSISSRQLARHLDLPVKTAYSVSQRVRKALLGTRSPLLQGIIELDETYIDYAMLLAMYRELAAGEINNGK